MCFGGLVFNTWGRIRTARANNEVAQVKGCKASALFQSKTMRPKGLLKYGKEKMLTGKKCKVGDRSDREHKDFRFYEGVIASEAFLSEPDEFRLLVMVEGKLLVADTHYMYDIESANN